MVRQRSREQLYAEGKAIRDTCPRVGHVDWKAPADRSDPIEIWKHPTRDGFQS